ncbi:hypothetical protein OUZ56_003234 [Daphnia magna]|uniref:Uncharacterized protein n=1 Tax=Daphnia magna TaxID=35525 RepID=A0ABR0A862_9CRUS|nr:hypothetical protein OUZ56_003234 [Daphnia magna]
MMTQKLLQGDMDITSDPETELRLNFLKYASEAIRIPINDPVLLKLTEKLQAITLELSARKILTGYILENNGCLFQNEICKAETEWCYDDEIFGQCLPIQTETFQLSPALHRPESRPKCPWAEKRHPEAQNALTDQPKGYTDSRVAEP